MWQESEECGTTWSLVPRIVRLSAVDPPCAAHRSFASSACDIRCDFVGRSCTPLRNFLYTWQIIELATRSTLPLREFEELQSDVMCGSGAAQPQMLSPM